MDAVEDQMPATVIIQVDDAESAKTENTQEAQ